jgi:outer membrane lipoprotein carrier protein
MRDAMRVLALSIALSIAGTWAGAAGGDPDAEAARAPSPPAPAAADCAAALTARVQARYDRMRDLEARFVQRTASALAPSGEKMSGRVVLAKPGRMRWSYETPEPSEVVSDGRTLWIYDPAAREAQRFAVGEQFLSGAAFQFLLGSGRIADSFHVSADRCDAPRVRLTLRPKADATYQALELEIDAASGEASATAVLDLFGNRTEVEFSELRYDRAPAASTFEFAPPPGVRVLEPQSAAH